MSKKKLRIAIVVGTFPTVSETFIVNILNSLKESGHEVDLFSYYKQSIDTLHPSLYKYHWLENVNYFNRMPKRLKSRWGNALKLMIENWGELDKKEILRCFSFWRYGFQVFKLEMFYEALWFLRKQKYDVIHVHFGPNAERIGKLRSWEFLKKAKLVATFHGYDLMPDKENFYRKAYTNIWNYFDAYTVNTSYLGELMNKQMVSEDKITIIPMGLDIHFFQRKKKVNSSTPFRLLFCGRLISLKGVDILIQAVALLKKDGVTDILLLILGDGPERMALEKLTKKMGVDEMVKFMGSVTQLVFKEELENGHLLVMPGRPDPETGREETQGLVIQEAQSMQVPVIVSNIGGMPFGLKEGMTGLVVPSENPKALANAILELKDNREMYQSFAKSARAFVESTYDNSILCKRWVSLFEKL